MISKEEREALRARCGYAESMGNTFIDCVSTDAIYALLDALDKVDGEIARALKTCPNGGNDGYITPRPCQLANCEECHAEHEITMDGIKADRDAWKTRAEALERAIKSDEVNAYNAVYCPTCATCVHRGSEMDFIYCAGACNTKERRNWQFDEQRFSKEANDGQD